jgi:hypothetical protein
MVLELKAQILFFHLLHQTEVDTVNMVLPAGLVVQEELLVQRLVVLGVLQVLQELDDMGLMVVEPRGELEP